MTTNRKPPELFATFGLALVLAACPSPKMPDGPPPEYEDPPAPSWYAGDAGSTETETPAIPTDAPADTPTDETPEPEAGDASAS